MRPHVLTLTGLAILLHLVDPMSAAPPEPSGESIRSAVGRGLTMLQKGATEYTVKRTCFSCHHQAFPVLVFTAARARGFAIDEKELQRQLQFTADFLAKNRANYEKGRGQGGQVDTAGYGLLTLEIGGWKADTTTGAVIDYLLQRDKDRDHWLPVSQRPPTEGSHFTTTYVALKALKKFGPVEKQMDIDARIEKVRSWLLATRAGDTEDRVSRMQALRIAGAEEKEILAETLELLKSQREDGGWSQTGKLEPDAYATGVVLAALHQVGGLPVTDDAYQRGVKFLLKTQQGDGSWHVRSRSKPIQLYFESGFPHGKDQFISMAASSWATMALVLACDDVKAK